MAHLAGIDKHPVLDNGLLEYPEGDTWDRILRDTIISGLASDKIRAKIIKEGKDVTLARVMEIS